MLPEYTYPNIVGGGIVRNRDWILRPHLAALRWQQSISALYYVTGDNNDETEQILFDWNYYDVPLWYDVVNYGAPDWERDEKRTGYRYNSKVMAEARNQWGINVTKRFPKAAAYYVCDSDIVLISPWHVSDHYYSLLKLEDAAVVTGYVPVAAGRIPIAMLGRDKDGRPCRTGTEKELHTSLATHEATLVGGEYLIRGDVLRRNPTPWGEDKGSEDFVFAKTIADMGYKMYINPRAYVNHYMERDKYAAQGSLQAIS